MIPLDFISSSNISKIPFETYNYITNITNITNITILTNTFTYTFLIKSQEEEKNDLSKF
jgi:K+-transporting ATPase A subunit